VVHHCRRHKRNFLERKLRDSDLVQEVAMKVSENLVNFRGKTLEQLIVWLTSITENLIVDYSRRYQSSRRNARREVSLERLGEKGQQLPDRPANPDVDNEKIAKAREALAQLPERYQDAVKMRIYDLRSFRHIGAQLGCSEDAARMMFHRAAEMIHEKLAESK
jgi:RNA polymerase sigma factor (sigma-70 family)